MKAAVYLRVSSDEQRERQSIVTQREFADRFCALHDIPIVGYYADDGISGALPLETRPDGRRLLHDAKQGIFDTILVYKLDRLGRSARVIHNAVHDLEIVRVALKSITEPFDTTNPAGRAHIDMLATFAEFERENTIQRVIDGLNRHARQGVWIGGNVPYGYHVVTRDTDRWLLIAEEPIPGMDLSAANVIRLIFRMVVEHQASCPTISDHLNLLGVPPAYVLRQRKQNRQTTAGFWRPGTVRTILTNSTYYGLHRYGKQVKHGSKRPREIIEREVPAIVSREDWDRAQLVLRNNLLYPKLKDKRQYLLRGLITCGCCNRNFIGKAFRHGDVLKPYYICTGRNNPREAYGDKHRRCPSKTISAQLEDVIWQDIETFGRNPGEVLQQLSDRMQDHADETERFYANVARYQQAVRNKQSERDAVLGLFRRGRIRADDLDRQLDQIDAEEARLHAEVEALMATAKTAEANTKKLQTAEALLDELQSKLDQPLTWTLKRQLVETLVVGIRVDTTIVQGKKAVSVTITYCFAAPANDTVKHVDWLIRAPAGGVVAVAAVAARAGTVRGTIELVPSV